MKTLTTLAAAICILSFTSCADKDDSENSPSVETPSAVDNKPFKLEACMNKDVHPGDNMFNYSYGKWIDNDTSIAVCDMTGALEAKLEKIANTPESDNFVRCLEEYVEAAKEDIEVLNADLKRNDEYNEIYEELSKADSRDEVIKIWAKLIKEGYVSPNILGLGCNEKGIYISPNAPNFFNAKNVKEIKNESRVGYKLRSCVFDELLKELGVSTDLVNYNPLLIDYFDYLDKADIITLKLFIVETLKGVRNLLSPRNVNEKKTVEVVNSLIKYARLLDVSQYSSVGFWTTQQENDAVRQMTEELKETLVERITDLDWMSSTTKHNAIDKVKNILPIVVGGIDTRNQKLFTSMAGESLCESYMKMNKGMLNAALSLVGKPRTETNLYFVAQRDYISEVEAMYEYINAFYLKTLNSIFICPAFGSFPFIDLSQTDAMLYGALGMVAGHELIHSIDTGGADCGIYGEVNNWWTDNDYQTFKERAVSVVNSYSCMDAIPYFYPSVKNNGDLTLDENIADIGGLNLAIAAYKKHLTKQGIKDEEMDKCLRKMFVSAFYGIAERCTSEKAIARLNNDLHSYGETRFGGMCRNIDEWYRLFNVEPQHKLYLAPERRCKIW